MEFVTLDEPGINRQRDFGKKNRWQKDTFSYTRLCSKAFKMQRGISVKKSKTKRVEPRVWTKIK